jgi:hypothetical protein
MRRKQNSELPIEVKRVGKRLGMWRDQRQQGQRIPEKLWSAAVRASRHHGLNCVSTALGLDYSCLKRRAEKKGQACKAEKSVMSDPLFMEVTAQKAEGATTCVVELEKGNGAKLRVCVVDAATIDWCRLKEAFLGA